jgi:hypothetical protein
MPVQHVGFKLEPCGFFDCNPALDVPRERCGYGAATLTGESCPQAGNGNSESY